MIFKIPQLLTPAQLQEINAAVLQGEFIDGKLTAGWHAKLVKNNQQLSESSHSTQALRQQVIQIIAQNPLFQIAVRPRKIHSLLFSRYDVGMSYGRHTDNALMGQDFWRSDVSFTLFLNSPDDYDGGELAIEGADDEHRYKLKAGAMIVYPSTTLHRVEAVTRGSRFVVVGWAQSLVRDAQKREILFDLETARQSIFQKSGKTPEFDLMSKSIANLMRRWVD